MIKKVKNICCIGAGYVGGPTMAVIADNCPYININVIDKDIKKIENWNSSDLNNLPVFEPGLPELIKRCRGINLNFSTNFEKHISQADMIFISVNTPTKTMGLGAGQASDLKWVDSCSRLIAKYAQGDTIVVEKSTLPVKTAQTVKEILESQLIPKTSKRKSFVVLSNPEFLSEGTAINDLQNPDRVLIGGEDKNAVRLLSEIYLNWISLEKIITSNIWSSELSKLIANAFLAQRISSINSITALCESTGADIRDVSIAIGMDSRIGKDFLSCGPGFGGSCFKKDILNLVYICNHYGLKEVSAYWQKVVEINTWQINRISEIVVRKLFGTISEKKIAILGFAFKANTNDTRESPAINLCLNLLEEGCYLNIYDPKVNKEKIISELNNPQVNKQNIIYDEKNCKYSYSLYEAFEGVDAIIVMTEWEEFKKINWKKVFKMSRKPTWIFDTRSVIDLKKAEENGFNTWRIGNGD